MLNKFYEAQCLDLLVTETDELPDFPVHMHRHVEYHYIEEGTQEVIIGEKEYVMHTGDCLIVFPYIYHGFKNSKCRQFFSVIDLETLKCFNSLFMQYEPECPVANVPEYMCEMFRYAFNASMFKGKYMFTREDIKESDTIMLNIAHRAQICAVGEAMRHFKFIKTNRSIFVPPAFCQHSMDLLVSDCVRNCSSGITLEQAAQKFGLRKEYVSGFFVNNLGVTFNDFINECKVKYACSVMQKEPDLKITDVAGISGFSSLSLFNTAFKKTIGMTPSEYKKQDNIVVSPLYT